jgi:3,4-dihydroxy-2-butanone 4-phosphate synthase
MHLAGYKPAGILCELTNPDNYGSPTTNNWFC